MTTDARIGQVRAELQPARIARHTHRCGVCGAPLRTAAIRTRHLGRVWADGEAVDAEVRVGYWDRPPTQLEIRLGIAACVLALIAGAVRGCA